MRKGTAKIQPCASRLLTILNLNTVLTPLRLLQKLFQKPIPVSILIEPCWRSTHGRLKKLNQGL